MAQMMVIGAFHAAGISKGTQKPYTISKLIYARQIQQVEREGRTVIGHGMESQEIDLDPQAVTQFAGKKFPALMEVKIECKPDNPQRNWVVGVA